MIFEENIKEDVKKHLSVLNKKVKIINFTQEIECQFCRETRQLVTEMSELSNNLDLEVYNFVTDKEVAEKYNVDKIPAIILLDENDVDYGIKFYGIPSGYEFSSLLEDLLMLGTGNSKLPANVENRVKQIDSPVHIQVFVTPTCSYCPRAVLTAHRFAFVNKNIKADMVEATEFPHLANRYSVRGVPRSIINENDFIEGAVPDNMFLDKINEALMKLENN
ncbi:NADH dehydrogenase [bacterium BMS3Abin04]|nr:NADH dehydrogenase [bacterium BMS3Abin04]